MSFFDKIVAAVTPLESDEDRRAARANARQAAREGDWLTMVLNHHEQIEHAFDAAGAASDPASHTAALRRLALLLTGHSNAEEAVLYPAMADSGEKGSAGLAYEEQAVAKVQMAMLEWMDPLNQDYVDKFEHLRSAVLHHMYQEESHWLLELKQHGEHQEILAARYREEINRYAAGALA